MKRKKYEEKIHEIFTKRRRMPVAEAEIQAISLPFYLFYGKLEQYLTGGLMIDKPKCSVEKSLEKLFQWCKKIQAQVKGKLSKPKSILKGLTAAYPLLTKIVTATACVAVCGLVIVGFSTPKQVTVLIDDSITTTSTVYKTTARRVDTFLENHEIDYKDGQDLIDVEMDDPITEGMTISITKEFHIEVTADGETTSLTTVPATTKDILQELNITLDADDIVEPSLDTQLVEGDQIVVKRVTKETVTEEKEIDFDVVYQADSSITIGDVQVTQKGRKGLEEKTYEVTYIDGEESDKTLVKSEMIKEKRNKVISYGTKISFGKPAGLQYERKISGVRAVSYYFSGNPVGSYGLPCEFGTVAVDPDLIPLGSLLYIEGYGYAIANDVGSAIKGKVVDLYMEKYEQCLMWGARQTTVYVIDEA